MNNPRFIILVGCPCAGKTTYARSKVFTGFKIIDPNNYHSMRDVSFVINKSLSKNESIVIDACNPLPEDRNYYLTVLKLHALRSSISKRLIEAYSVECHHLTTTYEQAVANGEARHKRGGDKVNKIRVLKYFADLIEPVPSEKFSLFVSLPFVHSKLKPTNKAAIVSFSMVESRWLSAHYYELEMPKKTRSDLYTCYKDGHKMFFVFVPHLFGSMHINECTFQPAIIRLIRSLKCPIEDVVYCLSKGASINEYLNLIHKVEVRHSIDITQSIMMGSSEFDRGVSKIAQLKGFHKSLIR